MKKKSKGKIHPSPVAGDRFSVLNMLPAAILAVIAVLSFDDREVLAYMITRSMTAGTSSPKSASNSKNPRNGSKKKTKKRTASAFHAPPVFDCDCFDCYTCYWFRWDSSPNREIIHLAIEAFEDRLATGDSAIAKTKNGKKGKKSGRRVATRPDPLITVAPSPFHVAEVKFGAGGEDATVEKVSPENSSEKTAVAGENVTAVVIGHKALARKVLPDVFGVFNSRLWSLWNPNA